MKKVLLITAILVGLAFAYNAGLGTKGTFETYSADCENMGTLNLLSPHVYFIMDDILGVSVMGVGPSMTVSFAPWHYLEFSMFANTVLGFIDPLSGIAYMDGNGGGIVKGGVPIYLGAQKRSFIAPGIAGFVYYKPSLMHLDLSSWGYDEIGADITALGFGGLGLLTFDFDSKFRININGGYRSLNIQSGSLALSSVAGMDIANNYLTTKPVTYDPLSMTYPIATSTVMGGVSLEYWMADFFGIIVDGVASVPQNDLANFLNYVYVVPGLRFGFGSESSSFNIDFGGKLDIPDNNADDLGWAIMGGLGVAFDLMPDKGNRIRGIVVDKETAEPIVGAKVYISGHPGINPSITEEDGRFSVKIPEGAYTLVSEHPDYLNYYIDSELIEFEEGVVMLEMVSKTAGAVVMGTVTGEEDKAPVAAELIFQRLDTEADDIVYSTEPVTGYYRTKVPAGTYRMYVAASGYKRTHKSMMLSSGDEVIVDFMLEPTFKPVLPEEDVALPSIYFDRGGDFVSGSDTKAIQQAIRMLETDKGTRIQLQGYTDSVGESEMNYRLSVRRAEAVKEVLVRHGIDPYRINVVGFGEFEPKGDNRTRSGRRENRRVDIVAL
ncbi:OmpA family protein [candidate division WOR-3 bacterium]|uniref:OmpA family protein n=1 Tax=candidate division WOR-3 bacterium TaxID=2052148 RepID=A0A9D5QCS2_UNCW3|nr:OmpA family protein [candidate division WOR-3 bacterium]MBD3364286.1 OmpA family protein [candidate division WOR-3 bacterium]